MNTTAIYSSDHSWSRRCSTESILSIQGRETDVARDTSDTDDVTECEYEPVSEPDDGAPLLLDTGTESENDIIATKVISVCVGDDGDLVFADSEATDGAQSDSDVDLVGYWRCAQCRGDNDNPAYSYCRKCFHSRKSLFPPRPRRKHRRTAPKQPPAAAEPAPLSQDSGVDACSQGPSQDLEDTVTVNPRKRRAASAEPRDAKAARLANDSDTDCSDVSPPAKAQSEPAVTKKVIADTLKQLEPAELCIVCVSERKSGVFVHGRVAHICCCYRCAVRVWARAGRCPVCNSRISNVLRAVVM